MTVPILISLDGIDGVGKSTQILRLADHLGRLGHDVLCVRDPGTTDVGTRLRELLLDSDLTMHRRTEAMLFLASRCEMIETVIAPAMAAGKTVISDRFLLSTVVYQSVGGEVSPQQLWDLGRLANGAVAADMTILLDMPAVDSMARIQGPADRMESRGVDYMESVRQAFLDQLPHASGTTAVVDAGQGPDQVADQIQIAMDDFLASRVE
ncbi:Thymidylate kinase [Rubripirellula lacrimiformis]|uniref:Thymidylate kinase n=1 Tax=Rubripirellula lacrimiformis TaxID=1930273 RepID=A0A517NFY8_9BACT|nr:dTMP kinase [Rubripirellula lacrimiformis]QDT06054.1 Thymidylate kinase [Rubripirellula lacrimiformis]